MSQAVFKKITHAGYFVVKNSNTDFNKSQTNSLVADTRSQTDRQTDGRTDGCGLRIRRSLLLRKEGLTTTVSCDNYT
jgi:hypothetical protein